MDTLHQRMLGRRRFIRFAGALAAAAGIGEVLGRPGEAAASETVLVYFFDPEWGADDPHCPQQESERTGSCHACQACHGHAVKLFASSAAAEAKRAHRFCKCLIGTTEVDRSTSVALFGPPRGPHHRDEFDRRRDDLFLPRRAGQGR